MTEPSTPLTAESEALLAYSLFDPDDSRRGCLVIVSFGRVLCRFCERWHRA